jgi:hypothetical protein
MIFRCLLSWGLPPFIAYRPSLTCSCFNRPVQGCEASGGALAAPLMEVADGATAHVTGCSLRGSRGAPGARVDGAGTLAVLQDCTIADSEVRSRGPSARAPCVAWDPPGLGPPWRPRG